VQFFDYPADELVWSQQWLISDYITLASCLTYLASSLRSRTWLAARGDGPGDDRGGVHGRRLRLLQRRRNRRRCRCDRCRTRRPLRPRRLTGDGPWPCCTTGRPWTQWDRTGTRRASFGHTRSGHRIPWPRGPCWTRPWWCRSDHRSWLGSGTSSPWRCGALSRTVISSGGAHVRTDDDTTTYYILLSTIPWTMQLLHSRGNCNLAMCA